MLTEEQLLLQEIFAVPSDTTQSGRFDKAALAANCPTPGRCKSGVCMSYLNIDHAEDTTCH